MEQIPSNTPMMDAKPGPAGWLAVWIKVITKPGEQTFIDITETPEATSKTAFIWMFIVGTLSGMVQALLVGIRSLIGAAPQFPIPGLEQFSQQSSNGGGIGSVLISFCASPIAGLLVVLFFALGVAIIQWIAKLFGGTGTFEKSAYAFAAISVPVSLVSLVLTLFSVIPFVGLCTGLISIGLSLYALFLQITAIKAINRFGWGQAAGSVLIPSLVILFVCGCLVIGSLMLLGPMIGNVFSGINQSLAP
ncbi:MAG: Yip1 family protein [Anaerolineales bacterium]